MAEIIFFNPGNPKAKGLNIEALPDSVKIQNYFFKEDLDKLSLLNSVEKFHHEKAKLFYPGCGTDILSPLLYLDMLFPKIIELTLIMNDLDDFLQIHKTILDDVRISFLEKDRIIKFYWNSKLITLSYLNGNVHTIDVPTFDIYFERAFRIMKDEYPNYEQQIYEKMNKSGILISDSGFQKFGLDQYIVPKELSSYDEMIIGKKR